MFEKICEITRGCIAIGFLLLLAAIVGFCTFYIPIHFILKYW